jgi:hypothetical protein
MCPAYPGNLQERSVFDAFDNVYFWARLQIILMSNEPEFSIV